MFPLHYQASHINYPLDYGINLYMYNTLCGSRAHCMFEILHAGVLRVSIMHIHVKSSRTTEEIITLRIVVLETSSTMLLDSED